jgi:zinc protease
MGGLTRTTLSNGLLVVLQEIHTAPIISQWIWYRVGSRDEVAGGTGLSHWVEHMQFKGSPRFPPGELDRAISRLGGYWNAFTFLDWTCYFETLPAESIDLALCLEADRMNASLFKPEDVESERTVIISERQGSENEPVFQLGEAVQSAAFRVHGYRHEVIGDMADLQSIQRDDLLAHYRMYYQPNNAVLALAGDFETSSMLDRLRELYEPLSAGGAPRRRNRPEPPQNGECRVNVEGPGETTYIELSYKVPAAVHPDFFPLLVADSLLSGPGSLNMFSEGISNKTSRLYRALVERELAVSIYGGMQATLDPFLYSLSAVMHPQSTPERVIAAVDEEIGRLQAAPPAVEELKRAVKQARALFAYGSERITNQAYWMGFSEMVTSYDWFSNFLANLEAVTPEQVQQVAQKYLRPQNRVLGVYIPDGSSANDSELSEMEMDDDEPTGLESE